MDDINDLGSRDHRPFDAMNNSRLRIILTILVCEPMDLNAMNSSMLW